MYDKLDEILNSKNCSPTSCTWIEINLNDLKHNVKQIYSMLPEKCKMMSVIKGNAYGHGAIPIAKELNSIGIKNFCVATVEEGVQLRKNDIIGNILVLGYTDSKQFESLYKYELTQTVISLHYAKLLNNYAKLLNNYGKKINVHICVDSGMHRFGERCEDIDNIAQIFKCENLNILGLYTHLCVSDSILKKDKVYTQMQYQSFLKMILTLNQKGISCPLVHLQATNGLLNYPEIVGDYVRIGSGLFGLFLSKSDADNCQIDLRPIISLKTKVAMVKTIMKDESVGYGLKFTAKQTSKICVLPIGYSDGYFRTLSCGVGKVIINGYYAPIIGNICMNQTIVDITNIPQVKIGDIAILIGKSNDKEITVYDIAEKVGMYPQEMLCYLENQLERIVVS